MKLTGSRLRTLYHIAQFIERDGWPPTVREIASATGYRSTHTVHRKLVALERLGLIERDNRRRMIRLTDDGWRWVERVKREKRRATA